MPKPDKKSAVLIKPKRTWDVPLGKNNKRYFSEGNVNGKTKVAITDPFTCPECRKPTSTLRTCAKFLNMVCDKCAGV